MPDVNRKTAVAQPAKLPDQPRIPIATKRIANPTIIQR